MVLKLGISLSRCLLKTFLSAFLLSDFALFLHIQHELYIDMTLYCPNNDSLQSSKAELL